MSIIISLSEQRRVLNALILREMKTRFGHSRIGYVWAFVEPLAHVMTFVLIWKVIGRLGPAGVEPMLFLITGIVPFLMLRNTAKNVMAAVKSNKALVVFPQVNMLDFCLARGFLELCTYAIIFAVMLYGSYFVGIEFEIENLSGVIIIFVAIWLLSFGLGLFLLPILAAFPVTNMIYAISHACFLLYFRCICFHSASCSSGLSRIFILESDFAALRAFAW